MLFTKFVETQQLKILHIHTMFVEYLHHSRGLHRPRVAFINTHLVYKYLTYLLLSVERGGQTKIIKGLA